MSDKNVHTLMSDDPNDPRHRLRVERVESGPYEGLIEIAEESLTSASDAAQVTEIRDRLTITPVRARWLHGALGELLVVRPTRRVDRPDNGGGDAVARVRVTVSQPVTAEVGAADVRAYLVALGFRASDRFNNADWIGMVHPKGHLFGVLQLPRSTITGPALTGALAALISSVAQYERRPPADVLRDIAAPSQPATPAPAEPSARLLIADLREFARSMAEDWDCDTGANGAHPHYCRVCRGRKHADKATAYLEAERERAFAAGVATVADTREIAEEGR